MVIATIRRATRACDNDNTRPPSNDDGPGGTPPRGGLGAVRGTILAACVATGRRNDQQGYAS